MKPSRSRRLLAAQLSTCRFLWFLLLAMGLTTVPGFAQKNRRPALAAGKVPAVPLALNVPRLTAVADSLARVQLATGTLPGLSVAIAQSGRVVFARGYGQANVEMSTAATPETEYKIRSITKQFTAALVLRLAEAGKLSLDAPITQYLPDYPTQGHTVTVRQLLNHTSGLTGQSSRLDMQTALTGGTRQWFKQDLSYKEMVERFGKEPFDALPGTRFQYINLGYYLLSEIVERVTGVPYPEYVERELLRPLGLAHTLYADDHRVIPNRAAGYEYYGGQLHNAPYVSPVAIGVGAGGLCSTVGDLVRWTHLLYGGKVVSAASLRQMTAPTVLASGDTVPYGFGLYQGRLGAHRKVYHGGTRPGFGGYLAHYPADSLTIVVLTNAGGGREKAEEIEKTLAQTAFGLAKPPAPLLVGLSPQEYARYEGNYILQAGTRTLDLRVFSEGGQLMGQASGQAAARLRYQGNHEFLVGEGNDIRLGFSVAQDRAESVTLYQGGRTFPGKRKA